MVTILSAYYYPDHYWWVLVEVDASQITQLIEDKKVDYFWPTYDREYCCYVQDAFHFSDEAVLSDQTVVVSATRVCPCFMGYDLVGRRRHKVSFSRLGCGLVAHCDKDCSETTEDQDQDYGQGEGLYSCHNLLQDFNFEFGEEGLADFDFRPFADTHKSSFDVRRGALGFDSEMAVDKQDFVGIVSRC